ncbi:MAG: prepilin-type N-terminal cleavage/methylation domain-containing protein [Puniceicoccales bacterium]
MTPTPLSSDRRIRRRPAFTLVEILVVIAVILILSGIVVGVAGGVAGKQARSRAQADIQALGSALESYKLKYGDYPWVTDEEELFYHLTGQKKMMPEGTPGNVTMVDVSEAQQRPFVDESKFSVTGNEFTDPWGLPYEYEYRTSSGSGWKRAGFILYSKGADGKSSGTLSDGDIPQNYFEQDENIDNIVFGYEF